MHASPRSPALPFGNDTDGNVTVFDTRTTQHLLIAGASGTGKTVAVRSLLAGAALTGADIYITETTRDADEYTDLAPYAVAVAATVAETVTMLEYAWEETQRRVELCATLSVRDVGLLPAGARPAKMFIVVDEFRAPGFVDKDAPGSVALFVASLLRRIARDAERVGVHFILTTSRVDSLTVPSFRELTAGRGVNATLLLGPGSAVERSHVFTTPSVVPHLGRSAVVGTGVYQCRGSAGWVQVWPEPGAGAHTSLLGLVRPPLWPDEQVSLL